VFLINRAKGRAGKRCVRAPVEMCLDVVLDVKNAVEGLAFEDCVELR